MLARPDPLSEIQNGDVALFRDTPGIDQIGIDMRRGGEAQAREDSLVIGYETRELEGGVGVCRCDD